MRLQHCWLGRCSSCSAVARKRSSSHRQHDGRKREQERSIATLTTERNRAISALRREEATSKRLRQENIERLRRERRERDALQEKIRKSVNEAVRAVQNRCVSEVFRTGAKLEHGVRVRLREMRAEVLRQKFLRESDQRAATKSQEAAANIKENALGPVT